MAPKKEKAAPPASKPAKSGGGKQKKKKWSKGKQKEKVNNAVLFDQASYDKMLTEVPKYKMITPSVLSDRLRVCNTMIQAPYCDSSLLPLPQSFIFVELLSILDDMAGA
ncbi:40S ribosomal protein S25-4 [Dendrobium catenatum]|uniref:40S ribosomal protein S25 n=1 Tax=Dendrobium catenatum TaxID=906689 RepID=A0A2I0VLD1_9ASPA|nr:40S ribosomal protein S25-4 [Dendrobium catenatum]